MKRLNKTGWFLIILGTLALLINVGCGTVRGMGEDLEDAGEAVQDSAT